MAAEQRWLMCIGKSFLDAQNHRPILERFQRAIENDEVNFDKGSAST